MDIKYIKELFSVISPSPWVLVSYEGQTKTGKHKHSICSDADGRGLSDEHTCVGDVWHENENVSRANADAIVWIRNNMENIINILDAAERLANAVEAEYEKDKILEMNVEDEETFKAFKNYCHKIKLLETNK